MVTNMVSTVFLPDQQGGDSPTAAKYGQEAGHTKRDRIEELFTLTARSIWEPAEASATELTSLLKRSLTPTHFSVPGPLVAPPRGTGSWIGIGPELTGPSGSLPTRPHHPVYGNPRSEKGEPCIHNDQQGGKCASPSELPPVAGSSSRHAAGNHGAMAALAAGGTAAALAESSTRRCSRGRRQRAAAASKWNLSSSGTTKRGLKDAELVHRSLDESEASHQGNILEGRGQNTPAAFFDVGSSSFSPYVPPQPSPPGQQVSLQGHKFGPDMYTIVPQPPKLQDLSLEVHQAFQEAFQDSSKKGGVAHFSTVPILVLLVGLVLCSVLATKLVAKHLYRTSNNVWSPPEKSSESTSYSRQKRALLLLTPTFVVLSTLAFVVYMTGARPTVHLESLFHHGSAAPPDQLVGLLAPQYDVDIIEGLAIMPMEEAAVQLEQRFGPPTGKAADTLVLGTSAALLGAGAMTTSALLKPTSLERWERREVNAAQTGRIEKRAGGGGGGGLNMAIATSAAAASGGLMWHALHKDAEAKKVGYGVGKVPEKVWRRALVAE